MTTRIQSRAIDDGAVTGPKVAAESITDSKIAATSRFPVGAMTLFGGATAPNGWLLCQGQAVSRATNAALFAAIGTTWGAGDGSTTFNLPDLRGRAPIGAGTGPSLTARTLGATGGAETHQLTIPEMPAHTHTFGTSGSGGGGISSGGQSAPQNTSSVGSGNAHNNMQPFAVVNYIIKT